MKLLKQMCEVNIIHSAYEVSILADIDDQINAYDNSITDRIEKWIKENYDYIELKISDNPNKDGLYEVTAHSVIVKNTNITSLTNGMFEWVKTEYFNCSFCYSLKSLAGAPQEVGGDFECYKCTSLKTLEGAPKTVIGSFECSKCSSLTSLGGAPKEIGRSFYCNNCNSLNLLGGAPKEIGRSFYCNNCNSLKSLEGAPKKVEIDFSCSDCPSLISLVGAPQEVGGDFYCFNCYSLTSLEGAPKKVKTFACFNCKKEFTKEDVEKISNVEVKIVV